MFWVLAIIVTLIALAALYYAARTGAVNAPMLDNEHAATAHFREQLKELERDAANGRLPEAEFEAARGELARELLRLKANTKAESKMRKVPRFAPVALLLGVAAIAFATYLSIGTPDLPALPLAGREQVVADGAITLDAAVAKVEERLKTHPEDARGWSVLGPVYMKEGRYDDAVHAYRQVLALLPPSADAETDLAEALMQARGGNPEGEPIALLESAAARDPKHVRSRFYLAGESMQRGNFVEAIAQWNALIALGAGDEPWVAAARQGIVASEAALNGEPLPNAPATEDSDQSEMIRGMVAGLAERLEADGGTLEEWQRLVRARLVLGERDKAQVAYDAAKAAYPESVNRATLDAMARDAGLE